VIKLTRYRPDFYGRPMQAVTQEAMRGPSTWSVGDRELMAAFIANANRSAWCTRAHTAVASLAFGEGTRVSATLTDLDTAPIDEQLRAMLRVLDKLTRENVADADDMRAALAAGVSREQIEDALAVCFAFNTITRLADAFGFSPASSEAFAAGAKYLLARGYR
jgi:alkylhydroperoxidase/carboxymuconolactone decarboxylase family protein YurZ